MQTTFYSSEIFTWHNKFHLFVLMKIEQKFNVFWVSSVIINNVKKSDHFATLHEYVTMVTVSNIT